MKSLNAFVLSFILIVTLAISAGAEGPLELDNVTGHYKDLSYDKISEE